MHFPISIMPTHTEDYSDIDYNLYLINGKTTETNVMVRT